ncbi:MAG: T9SS type A sorting domain-containing protein [bacterium]
MKTCKVFIVCSMFLAISFAPAFTNTSIGSPDVSLPFFGGRQSPGDIIGYTWYEFQANGSFGQRIDVDDLRQAHIVWMKMDAGGTNRYIAWNFRYSNGAYYGEIPATPSWSGYGQMDITRDLDSSMQRTVIAYHFNPGAGYYSWIDIDAGNGCGAWPNTPGTPIIACHIWPYIAVANNNNFILATGDNGGNMHHLYVGIDEGVTWIYIAGFDSCATLSQFVRASEKRDTNKVVFVHTQFITDSVAGGQLDNDVFYKISDDGGINWGPHTNITNYQPFDSVRAYCSTNALFDDNDHLHIAWAGRKVDSAGYYQASKIFHWDEFNDTITVVNSPSIHYNEPGGWWIEGSAGSFGASHMPADQPQVVFDTSTNFLYCLWHGNDDTTDVSAAGYFNGELYGAYSTDYGITWSDYVNLTNTRSPGAGPGYCYDEGYMTACPKVVTDSIFITYIEDKDAGAYVNTEGVETENPVRCWVFSTGLIRTGIEEEQAIIPKFQEPRLNISPNPFIKSIVIDFSIGLRAKGIGYNAEGIELRIYDATGRVVFVFPRTTPYALHSTVIWTGTDQIGHKLPAGIYFVELNTGDEIISKKVIKLK